MPIPNIYPVNKSIRLSVTFAQAGTNYDPATITAFVMSPAGVESSYVYGTDAAVQKDGVGQYHVDVTPGSAGTWSYRFEGATNNLIAANENTFYIQKSAFYN